MPEDQQTFKGPITGRDLLVVLLRIQPRSKEELQDWANKLGIRWSKVEQEFESLGVEFKKRGFPAKTYWQLPTIPTALERVSAEVHLSMWEYFILAKTAATANERLDALQKVTDTIKRHGGTV